MYKYPYFSIFIKERKSFCPKCKTMTKWNNKENIRICDSCGLTVRKTHYLSREFINNKAQ